MGARIAEDGYGRRFERLFEYNAGKISTGGCYFERKICAEILADKDDCVGGNVPGLSQILDRRADVLAPSCFAGMREMTRAVSPIVEGKDIQPCSVEPGKGIDSVAEIAVSAVQINGGKARWSRRWNPPAAQLWLARCVCGKADGVEREIYAGWRTRHG